MEEARVPGRTHRTHFPLEIVTKFVPSCLGNLERSGTKGRYRDPQGAECDLFSEVSGGVAADDRVRGTNFS